MQRLSSGLFLRCLVVHIGKGKGYQVFQSEYRGLSPVGDLSG